MSNQNVVKVELVKPIYKRWWVWVGGTIGLLILVGSLGGRDSAPAPSQNQPTQTPETKVGTPMSPSATPVTWHTVKSWSGTSAKKTEPFTITGKQWRIVWSNKDTTGFGATVLQVMVYKPGGSLPVEIAVNAQEGSDTSYIYKSGEFYLDINAANGSWSIKVEELR